MVVAAPMKVWFGWVRLSWSTIVALGWDAELTVGFGDKFTKE